MNLTALDSIASTALGAVIVAVAWLLKHDNQLKGVLNLLPAIAKDASTARTAVQTSGVAPAVHRVEAELSAGAKAMLDGVVSRLEALASPMAGGADTTPVPGDTDTAVPTVPDVPDPDPTPEVEPAPVPAPAGLAEGTSYTVVAGQLIPQTA